jgi:hypothetical protein
MDTLLCCYVARRFSFIRDICTNDMLNHCTMEIGGPGHVVEVDETSVKKKSKYNRGRVHEDCWLFGGVDRTTKKWFGVLVYNNRTKACLSVYIARYVFYFYSISMTSIFTLFLCLLHRNTHHD